MSKPDESEADFRNRLLPQLSEQLAEEKAKLEDTYRRRPGEGSRATVRTDEAKAIAQRMKFWTRLGTALWVFVDNVMSMMGRNLPGRRRSLDAAIRTMATETGHAIECQVATGSGPKRRAASNNSTTMSSSNWKPI